MFDPQKIKQDFPILSTLVHQEKPLVYLDSAATSQKPQVVIDAIVQYYTHDNANVHRGIHELGDRSTKVWHTARKTVANFFGADSEELVLVRNTTEALNTVAYSWGEANVCAGDLILATQMDHHSNLVPWQELAKRKHANFELVPVTSEGLLDLEWLEKKIKLQNSKIKVIALPHVSNTLGTINPIEKIMDMVKELREKNNSSMPIVVIDGAQAAPHLPIKFHSLGVDFYAVSAHKMLGPMGIGGLFVRKELLQQMHPMLTGGGMIETVTEQDTTFAQDLEDRFSAGTPDVAGVVGWAAACMYLEQLGMEDVRQHDQELIAYCLQQLATIPEIDVIGPTNPALRCGSVAFIYQGVHAHDVAQILDSEGVAVRSGHHCTMPLHHSQGWVATTRASFSVYTTLEDINVLVHALTKVRTVFGV